MYRCDLCSNVVPPGTPAERVITDVRPAKFPNRFKCQTTGLRKHRFKRAHWRDDPGGRGHQIVSEAQVCPACARATALARDEMVMGEAQVA